MNWAYVPLSKTGAEFLFEVLPSYCYAKKGLSDTGQLSRDLRVNE